MYYSGTIEIEYISSNNTLISFMSVQSSTNGTRSSYVMLCNISEHGRHHNFSVLFSIFSVAHWAHSCDFLLLIYQLVFRLRSWSELLAATYMFWGDTSFMKSLNERSCYHLSVFKLNYFFLVWIAFMSHLRIGLNAYFTSNLFLGITLAS